jgi:Xaa-Pro aminopeptidase
MIERQPGFMVKDRANRLRPVLQRGEMDAILLTGTPNLRYFCGFTGSDGALLVTAEDSVFLTDSRYTSQARQEVTSDAIRQYTGQPEGIARALRERGLRRIGFEAETLSYAAVERLRQKADADCTWIPLTDELCSLRGRKDEEELSVLAAVARIADEAFREILPRVRPGAVEQDLALELEFAMRRRGADDKAFPFIVASGERGALPHGAASDRRLRAGELVTFDFGASLRGYQSDETVTVAVGEVSPRLRRIYDVVFEAQYRALNMVRPGVPLARIDRAARDFIAQQGFGDFFGHGLGHGVGLEVHEYPVVSSRSEDTAEEGMVFTVEPGIYIPDLGGVRLEDTIQVTASGYRRLTHLPKDFLSLPA